ncbi:hypothetical protein FOPG_18737 [Fusarium oxysporum f. sp. conglutinans race 2 54008]|uniref:Uncharacterized protein n=1 Tax=Fusarium oxysporum f. sp. conglutinans race 2 54008 TaxID=1089457 RepID=X0GYP3_FUSOX|nr:hypothetical protein FOPG_18737 [Fusarium oxysporum f. sp. conglutinans race 2 54008]
MFLYSTVARLTLRLMSRSVLALATLSASRRELGISLASTP